MMLACAVTLVGLAVSLYGVQHHYPECLVFGLACDVIDGRVARAMDEVTDFGARLDWYSDVVVSHALVWSFAMPWLSVPLLIWQAYARGAAIRFSARALVTVGAVAMYFGGLW